MLVLDSPSEHCGMLQSWWRIFGSVVKHQGPVVVLSGLRHKLSRRSLCLCLWGKKLMEWEENMKQKWCLWIIQNCSKFLEQHTVTLWHITCITYTLLTWRVRVNTLLLMLAILCKFLAFLSFYYNNIWYYNWTKNHKFNWMSLDTVVTSSQVQQEISITYIYINKSGMTDDIFNIRTQLLLYISLWCKSLTCMWLWGNCCVFIFFLLLMEKVQRLNLKTTNECS